MALQPLPSINPATSQLIQAYPQMSDEEVELTLQKVHSTQSQWKKQPFTHKSKFLLQLAQVLTQKEEELSYLMANEMGKVLSQGKAEVKKCAWVCHYYAEQAEKFLSEEELDLGDGRRGRVVYSPLGIILGIMPWNFPFWQVIRFAIPTLMAGNACLLKHSSQVTGSALSLENIFLEAGFPEHLFRSLRLTSSRVGKIIESPLVQGVALTGSVDAGKAVASQAGKFLKKLVLELGGNDPAIILEDAPLPLAAHKAIEGRMLNTGQSCIATKRMIVVKSRLAEFENLCLEKLKTLNMGHPLTEGTDLGPLSGRQLRDEVHKQVLESQQKGAKCLLGGQLPTQKPFSEGAYYPPTLLTQVTRGMPAYHEEIFGPVVAIIPVENDREAIEVANDSIFGLGSSLYTSNVQQALAYAQFEIESGNCFINDFVKSDPRLPFGGIKQSGYGRELSHFGIKEFVNIKTIVYPK